jgi:hypothetical protein
MNFYLILQQKKIVIGVIDGILQDHSEGSEFPPAFHNLVAMEFDCTVTNIN